MSSDLYGEDYVLRYQKVLSAKPGMKVSLFDAEMRQITGWVMIDTQWKAQGDMGVEAFKGDA